MHERIDGREALLDTKFCFIPYNNNIIIENTLALL